MHLKRQMKIERHAFQTLFLHAQRVKILAVHLWCNRCDLNITICIYAFHQSCWSKIKSAIWRLRPIVPIKTHALQWCQAFLDVFEQSNYLDTTILKFLPPYTSRSISACEKCFKVRFHWENREKLVLKCRRSSSNLQNENPLIRQEIELIQALSQVRLCVFILISLPITLDFNFEL